MRIAYLIMTYHYSEHLKRLVQRLINADTHCFIHVDAKSDIASFHIAHPQVTFVEPRIDVNPNGFSTVQMILALFRSAVKQGNFDYYVLLSGQDYPLKSQAFIKQFLQDRMGTNFLSAYPAHPGTPKVENFSRHYYNEDWLRHIPRSLQGGSQRVLRFASKFLPARKLPAGMQLFRGSTWMALHQESVAYLFNYLESPTGKQLVRLFTRAWGPSEFFFHTILLNSPLRTACYGNSDQLHTFNGGYSIDGDLHYIDWSMGRAWDESAFSVLQSTPKLFSRKFDETTSVQLLEKIDIHLLENVELLRTR